jgi:SAM-dependent methyltransferase
MLQLPFKKLVKALLVNQAKRVPGTAWLQRVMGGRARGGENWAERDIAAHALHVLEIFDGIAPCVGDVKGRVGLEVGPGDDVGVAYCFLKAGARKMYTVERFESVRLDKRAVQLFETIDATWPQASAVNASDVLRVAGSVVSLDRDRLEHRVGKIEEQTFAEPLDFSYSNDVMEHVDDPATVFAAAFRALGEGGAFVNNIDLSGHNAFSNAERPLDFLTCPDWLWPLLSSHIVTTNRVRYHEFVSAAERAGFQIENAEVLVAADPAYLREIQRDLLPRFAALPESDLSVVQVRLSARKAAAAAKLKAAS